MKHTDARNDPLSHSLSFTEKNRHPKVPVFYFMFFSAVRQMTASHLPYSQQSDDIELSLSD